MKTFANTQTLLVEFGNYHMTEGVLPALFLPILISLPYP